MMRSHHLLSRTQVITYDRPSTALDHARWFVVNGPAAGDNTAIIDRPLKQKGLHTKDAGRVLIFCIFYLYLPSVDL